MSTSPMALHDDTPSSTPQPPPPTPAEVLHEKAMAAAGLVMAQVEATRDGSTLADYTATDAVLSTLTVRDLVDVATLGNELNKLAWAEYRRPERSHERLAELDARRATHERAAAASLREHENEHTDTQP